MTPGQQPLIPVGKDCDCGHPLIWRNNQQWCAVYGSHPQQDIYHRNPNAYAARLVDELDAMTVAGFQTKTGTNPR